MKNILLLVFPFIFCQFHAQVAEITPPGYIKTVEFKGASSEFAGVPIVPLGEGLSLEFDDLIGDEADYYYKISYYNFDWTPTSLSKNEYMSGFDNVRIKNYKNSFNTLQIYTHYKLTIPNRDTRALKVSGNYMLEIYDGKDQLVFSRRFMLFESIVGVSAETKRTRDLSLINNLQTVNFSIQSGNNFLIKNPDQNLHTLIVKNNNFQNSIYNLKPQFRLGNELIYRYDKEAAFDGGNEFYHFDTKDVRGTNVDIYRVELEDIYHAYLYTDRVRANQTYVYNPDINGKFVINNIRGTDLDIESEYMWVHFFLQNTLPPFEGQIHFTGGFNNFVLDDSTKMTLNPETNLFEGQYLFKQGFYDYKYVLVRPDGSVDEAFVDGNFDKTENQYVVLVYYREPGKRYDRIIGVGSANSVDITD